MHDRSDLVDGVILPSLEMAQESLIEVFEEMEGQLGKESNRIEELRKIRDDDPGQSKRLFISLSAAMPLNRRRTYIYQQTLSTSSTTSRR